MRRRSDPGETGKTLKRARQLKKDFDAAHRKGMRALERGDYKEFGVAIERERKVISALPRPRTKAATKRAG